MTQNSFNFEPFNLDAAWRESLTQVMKPFNRAYLADRLETLTGQKCSEAILNNWTAPSNGTYRTPAVFVPALCEVTQTTVLLDLLVKPIRPLVEKARLEELAKLEAEQQRINRRLAELRGQS